MIASKQASSQPQHDDRPVMPRARESSAMLRPALSALGDDAILAYDSAYANEWRMQAGNRVWEDLDEREAPVAGQLSGGRAGSAASQLVLQHPNLM